MYNVLPFLRASVYKDTAMLLVLAFFYRAITLKIPNFAGMVRQVREIRESE